MRSNAVKEARAQIERFKGIAKMEVDLKAAKQKSIVETDAKLKAQLEAYEKTLMAEITKAKKEAVENKLIWNTSFGLPVSDYSVKTNIDLNWKASAVKPKTVGVPAWWANMVTSSPAARISTVQPSATTWTVGASTA